VSSSSVTFAVPSLTSCDIFPEIAGVVSASDSETDFGDYLMQGYNCLHVGELVFSPPKPKCCQNSSKQSESLGDASVTEMLDTLCFSTHDLTHVNNVVENVVLDWQNGAALENSSTAHEIVKTELSCENAEAVCSDLQMNGCIVTLPEGSHYQPRDVLEDLLEYASESSHLQTASLLPVSGNMCF